MLLQDRVALVTGGAQGIGAGIVRVLAAHGARVAVADLQGQAAGIVAEAAGGIAIATDLTTAEGCHAAVEETVAALGGLDILVHCAAPARDRDLVGRLDGPDWPLHADLVIAATARLAEAAAPHLPTGGSIVVISSATATAAAPEQCTWAYHASKAGLDQLTRWLACRMGPAGVRVNAVAPALVDRDGGRKLSDTAEVRRILGEIVPLGRAGTAVEVGEVVAFLASPMAAYMTGQVLVLDGGLGAREVFGAALKAQP